MRNPIQKANMNKYSLSFFLLNFIVASISLSASLNHITDEREFFSEVDKPIPVINVSGILGKTSYLPCDISPSAFDDAVFMVLWFKNFDTEPIYSFDVRRRQHGQAKLWSSPKAFGSRAVFRTSYQPARLIIEDVNMQDKAVYRCRVDFKNSPTRHTRVNFNIIVVPNRPVIYGSQHRRIDTVIEAQNEGSFLTLSCEVENGYPPPDVFWYLEKDLLDTTFEERSNVVYNNLTELILTRNHLNSQLTCQANNTHLMSPLSKLVIINVNLRPLKAEILNKGRALSFGREYEVECLSTGSKPAANISWSLGQRSLKHIALKFPTGEHQVISIVKFTPLVEENGQQLICQAENPAIEGSVVEDRWTLNVQYFPKVSLIMGQNLNPKQIKEGDDVYFECNIRANPKLFRQAWFHNGYEIHQNVTAGIILTEKSLVLQKVTKNAAGNYTCMAVNIEGKGTSNPVILRVMYAPSCKIRREQLYGALKQETVVLKCEVDSNPKPTSFHWTFNNSGDTSLVSAMRYTQSGFISVINYTPVTDMDYGTLACWARNPIGPQKKPCIYQVVAAGRPFPLINCSISNQTEDSLQVACMENFDGGLPQNFLMELLEIPNLHSKFNVTALQRPPVFNLRGIESKASYRVKLFAINAKGFSDPVILETSSFNGPAKYLSSRKSTIKVEDVMTSIVTVFLILTGIAFTGAFLIVFYKCRHRFERRQQPSNVKEKSLSCYESNGKENQYVTTLLIRNSQSDTDSKGPDIITNIPGRSSPDKVMNYELETDFELSNQDEKMESRASNHIDNNSHISDISDCIESGSYTCFESPSCHKLDTYVVQAPSFNNYRHSPEVVTSSPKLQESCI